MGFFDIRCRGLLVIVFELGVLRSCFVLLGLVWLGFRRIFEGGRYGRVVFVFFRFD